MTDERIVNAVHEIVSTDTLTKLKKYDIDYSTIFRAYHMHRMSGELFDEVLEEVIAELEDFFKNTKRREQIAKEAIEKWNKIKVKRFYQEVKVKYYDKD
jgi:hypothetical protein